MAYQDRNLTLQKSYRNPQVLQEVCDEQTVNRITVSRWSTCFHDECISISNNEHPGRPILATEKRIVNLVIDYLKKHRWYCLN